MIVNKHIYIHNLYIISKNFLAELYGDHINKKSIFIKMDKSENLIN